MSTTSAEFAAPPKTKVEGPNKLDEVPLDEVPLNIYTPINKWQTRILRLHPGRRGATIRVDVLSADIVEAHGLVLHREQRSVSYEAISYAWGAPIFSSAIQCNGFEHRVTETLEAALREFRLPDRERYLWADALCIDQSSDEEKSFQVRNMFNIFRKADRVLAWIGREGRLDRLSESAWARRVWVQQEVFVARHVEVYYGSKHRSLPEIRSAKMTMAGEEVLHELDKQRFSEGRPHEAQACDCRVDRADDLLLEMYESEAVEGYGGDPFSLLTPSSVQPKSEDSASVRSYRIECVLHRHRHCDASNPRDHIYGLLSMSVCRSRGASSADAEASPQLSLPIDYSRSVSQVFQDVTRYIINRDRNLGILLSFAPGQDQLRDQKLPSWTPDWRIFQNHPNSVSFSGSSWALPWQEDTGDGVLHLRGTKLAEVITVEPPRRVIHRSRKAFIPDPRFPFGPNKVTCFSQWYCEHVFNIGTRDSGDYLPKDWLTEWICWTIGDARPGDYLTLVQGTNWLLLLRPEEGASGEPAARIFRYVGAALVCQQDIDVTKEKANWPYPHLLAGIHPRALFEFRRGMLQDFRVG